MAAPSETFDVSRYLGKLQHTLGKNIQTLATCGSTMDIASEWLNGLTDIPRLVNKHHGAVVSADCQTQGKGRRSRDWSSPPGTNLYFSFVWVPDSYCPMGANKDPFMEFCKLNLAIPTACARSCIAQGAPAKVKWPNDVWIGGHKVSGMLINIQGGCKAAIAGVGINVNTAPDNPASASVACTIQKIVGHEVSREEILADFFNNLSEIMEGTTMEQVISAYKEHDLLMGKTLRIHHGTREEDRPEDYDAVAIGFGNQGELRVRRVDTSEVKLLSGEEITLGVPS